LALQLNQHQASPYLMNLCPCVIGLANCSDAAFRKRAPWLSLAKKAASEEAAWG
jgi:hypothetical protein